MGHPVKSRASYCKLFHARRPLVAAPRLLEYLLLAIICTVI